MLKILYAASNSIESSIQLNRFLQAIDNKAIVKIAAYKKSSPPVNIDWTLDCLLNIYRQSHISFDNDNYRIYYEQVKSFSPDLIISDLEYFTSYIANKLNIPLWQCSSSMINFGLNHNDKYNLGLFKKYSYLFNKNPIHTQMIVNVINNSDANLIYSHLGDINNSPKIKSNFEWIRPYHILGKKSIPCQHNIVGVTIDNNKKLISLIKKYSDSIVFSKSLHELYSNITIKNIENQIEYSCNLKNCNMFICEGYTSFLADAFYNEKQAIILMNSNNIECIINSLISDRIGLTKTIFNSSDELSITNEIKVQYNTNIKFLHEKIFEVYNL